MTDMSDEEGMELQPSKNSKASRRASIIKDGREVINTEGTKSTGENEIEEQLLVTKEQNQEFTNELDASSASKPNYEIKMKKTTEIKEKKMKRRGRQAKTIATKEIFEEIKEPTMIQNSTNITETNIPVSPIHMSPSAIIASSSCTTALKSSSMAVQSSSSARVATNPPTKTAQNTAKSSAIATGISSGALRVLGSAGLKGSSLPLVLSMSGTSTAGGLSLLPAGLPPGRYVILPSSTSSVPSVTSISATMTQSEMKTETPIATTASLKQVTSASLFPSISTSPSVVQRPTTYFTGRVGRPARGSIQRSSLRRGTLHSGYSIRGRRKSYTAAEKLAMIEAVESGQKKSVVADQFGVAPSTLACILLQKHKIRCDQATDLTRRRLRRPRLSSGIYSHSSEIHEDSKDPRDDCNNDLSFGSHFLSPLSPSRENLFDQELPEEIISGTDDLNQLNGGEELLSTSLTVLQDEFIQRSHTPSLPPPMVQIASQDEQPSTFPRISPPMVQIASQDEPPTFPRISIVPNLQTTTPLLNAINAFSFPFQQGAGPSREDNTNISMMGSPNLMPPSLMIPTPDLRPPRNRKPNYSENEKQIFFALITPHIDLLDSKSQERQIMQLKLETWKYLTAKYNDIIVSLPGNYVQRHFEELRTFWKNIRRANRRRNQQLNEKESVPDLSDRVSMDSSGMVKSENISVGYTCTPMVTEDSNNPSGSGQRLQDNRGGFYNQYNLDHANMDVKPEPIFGIHSEVDEEHAMSNAGTSNHSSPSSRHPSPSPQGLTGPYLLKKETHCNTILDELLRDETYTDVTLTAEGQTIKAHRIILSLSSKYFKTVLSTDANAKNVIVFRDMKFQELKDIIGFIYTGEVTVDASDLDSFMKTADILEVTSLCNSQKNFPKGFNLSSSTVSDHELPKQPSLKRSNPNISQSPPSKARKASAVGTESTTGTKQSKRSIKHLPSPVISPPVATPSASINDPSQTNDEPSEDDLPEPVVVQADCILRDLDEPEQSLDPAPSNECCAACSSTFEDVDGLFQHLEEFHNNQDLFPCEVCVRIFLTAKSFNKHRNYCKPKMKTSE